MLWPQNLQKVIIEGATVLKPQNPQEALIERDSYSIPQNPQETLIERDNSTIPPKSIRGLNRQGIPYFNPFRTKQFSVSKKKAGLPNLKNC